MISICTVARRSVVVIVTYLSAALPPGSRLIRNMADYVMEMCVVLSVSVCVCVSV